MIPHIPETVESCFLFITIVRKECMEGASVPDFYQLTWSLIKIGSWSFIKFVKLKHIQEESVLLSSFFCKITHILCSSNCFGKSAQPLGQLLWLLRCLEKRLEDRELRQVHSDCQDYLIYQSRLQRDPWVGCNLSWK